MVDEEGNMAGPTVKKPPLGEIKRLFQAEWMGDTPDGEWSWYSVRKLRPDGHTVESIIGVIAESPDLTYFGTEITYRRYNIIFYEPSEYGEGAMPMTTARSLDDAVTVVVEQWNKRNQIARRAKASREADCTDSEIRGN